MSQSQGSPSDQWLGARARRIAIGAGLLMYLLAYGVAIAYGVTYFNRAPADRDDEYVVQLVYGVAGAAAALVVTALVLGTGLALRLRPRTRAFGTGLAIAAAIGTLGGAGGCLAVFAGIG